MDTVMYDIVDPSDCGSSTGRLGVCEVCAKKEAKYTCPKCEVKTCSADCVKIHKKELNCDGVRDRTKFIPLKKFTNLDFLSDFRLLQECGRNLEGWRKNKDKRCTRIDKDFPRHLFRLRAAATKRDITLKFLTQNFERNKNNTTYLNWKSNIIEWRIEWIFPNAENIKFVDERCDENTKMSKLLNKYLDPKSETFFGKDSLAFYQSAGLSGIKLLLKAEFVKSCKNKFHELDVADTLKKNLQNKTIVEFPIIYVVLREHSDIYDLVDTDDERHCEEMNYKYKKSIKMQNSERGNKKRKRTENKNLLFQNDDSDLSSSETDENDEEKMSDRKKKT